MLIEVHKKCHFVFDFVYYGEVVKRKKKEIIMIRLYKQWKDCMRRNDLMPISSKSLIASLYKEYGL